MEASVDKRTNYKLIKSAADLSAELTAGGGSKYLLNTITLYEINGTINLAYPIELNNAYLVGMDSTEDKLVRTGGDLFTGSTGGAIKMLTLSGGKVFNLTGSEAQNLILRDLVIASSASVGSISNYGMVFMSVAQYVGNTTGITFANIKQLLISNIGWFANNAGTYETFTGTFDFIQKQGGFMVIDGGAIGIDVSSNPTVTKAVLSGVSFSGTGTQYVKRYTTGSYTGYNFSNVWSVDSPGIPKESDSDATGNLYFDSAPITTVNTTAIFKLPVSTSAVRLFRTAEGTGVNSENHLIYEGEGRRAINVLGSISFTATAGSRYTFSINKNGTKVVGSDVIADVLQTNARQSVSIIGTVDAVKNDYIEIYVQKTTNGSEQFLVTSYNLIVD
jgi:hypothetical protein